NHDVLTFFFSSRRRHTRFSRDWSSDVCSSDLMKAGRKGPGQMKQSYFWPIFGDREEVVFTWSASRSRHHPEQQLHGFAGTLLTRSEERRVGKEGSSRWALLKTSKKATE